MKRSIICIGAALAVAFGAGSLWGGTAPDIVEQLRLLFKILSYEKRIAGEPKEVPVAIAILVPSSEAGDERASIEPSLTELAGEYEIAGRSIMLIIHRYRGDVETTEWIRKEPPSALVLSFCPEENFAKVLAAAAEAGVLTYTAADEHVHKGVMVTLLVKDLKPEIHIDLALARKVGRDFSSNLLRLVKIVE